MFGLHYCPKWWISWDTTNCGNMLLGKMKFKTIGSWDLCIPYFHTGNQGPIWPRMNLGLDCLSMVCCGIFYNSTQVGVPSYKLLYKPI